MGTPYSGPILTDAESLLGGRRHDPVKVQAIDWKTVAGQCLQNEFNWNPLTFLDMHRFSGHSHQHGTHRIALRGASGESACAHTRVYTRIQRPPVQPTGR
jgi:hypothetical protein